MYLSTSSEKPATPTITATNQAYTAANTNVYISTNWGTIGHTIFYDEFGINDISVPRAMGIKFDQSSKQSIMFAKVLPQQLLGRKRQGAVPLGIAFNQYQQRRLGHSCRGSRGQRGARFQLRHRPVSDGRE